MNQRAISSARATAVATSGSGRPVGPAIGAQQQVIARGLDPDVAADLGQLAFVSCIDDKAEFRGQGQIGRRRQALRQRLGKLRLPVVLASERRDDDVPAGVDLRIGVDQAETHQTVEQGAMARLGHAA